MSFHSIKPAELQENLFDLIGKDWFLMSAEKDGRVNPMTVAWATMGHPVAEAGRDLRSPSGAFYP